MKKLTSFGTFGIKMLMFFVVVLLCLTPSDVCAQNNYANRTLQSIGELLPELPTDNIAGSEVIVARLNPKRKIVVERLQDGTISHIGFKLFERDVMEKHSTPLYHFLERYMLSLILLEKDTDIYNRLKMDHVKIVSEIYPETPLKAGLHKVLSDDTSNSSVYITSNGQEYTVSCLNGDKLHIQMTFPKRHELITGVTKLEAERSFYPQLLAFMAEKVEEGVFVSDFDMEPYKENLFCAYRDSYWLDEMVSTSYYKKIGDKYTVLFDAQHTAESVYNLFNASHNLNITVDVTQSLYGEDNKLNFEVPISALTKYLRSQNCNVYTGIKKSKGHEMQLSVMAVNVEFGYQHLLSCSIDKRMLGKQDGEYKVKAKLYCYIPIHNISSLLGE